MGDFWRTGNRIRIQQLHNIAMQTLFGLFETGIEQLRFARARWQSEQDSFRDRGRHAYSGTGSFFARADGTVLYAERSI